MDANEREYTATAYARPDGSISAEIRETSGGKLENAAILTASQITEALADYAKRKRLI